jgi:hypothetical protein
MRFELRNGPEPLAGKFEGHAAFITTGAVLEKEFLTLLDIGCTRPDVTLTSSTQAKILRIGSQTITIPN